MYSESLSKASLTSLTFSTAIFFNTGIKFDRATSSYSPVHVEIAIPFLGWSLKLEAILSTIIVLERSLFMRDKSLILTKS